MENPMRSLTLPTGLKNSHLIAIVASTPPTTRFDGTSGVRPMDSTILGNIWPVLMDLRVLGITYRQLQFFGGWRQTSRHIPRVTMSIIACDNPLGKWRQRTFALRSM